MFLAGHDGANDDSRISGLNNEVVYLPSKTAWSGKQKDHMALLVIMQLLKQ